MNDIQPMPSSLWVATAEPAPETFPLDADTQADIAVIGSGYAGLSTALHSAEAGASVVLLEANDIGWGASGRSGGQVIPGIKYDPNDMLKMFGPDLGRHAARLFGSTADTVFDLVEKHGIACEATRKGWVQPAHSRAALQLALARCRQWEQLGANVAVLSKDKIAEVLGTSFYHGGWIDHRGGSVQPLSYTRGLARACLAAGVKIASHTRATSLDQDGSGWKVLTSNGPMVRARRVIVCTNGYSSGLWPGLERSVIAANSFQIATRPLPDELDRKILKGGIVASDTRRLLAYWRRDAGGRFILGGRGTFDDPTSDADFAHLQRMMEKIYPSLAGQPIEYRWGGRVALTQDFLPHLHEPESGLLLLVGCQGRGIGLQSSMGRWIANYIASGDPSKLPLPVTKLKEIPFHGLRRLYVSAMLAYYKAKDLIQ